MTKNHEHTYNHEHSPTPWHRSEKAQRIRAQVVEHMGPVSDEKPDRGSIDIVRALMGVCLQAHKEGRPLADDDAKTIAQLLSTAVASKDSYLAGFADGRGMLPGSMREEIAELLTSRSIFPEMREAANYLGNYMLSQEGYGDFLPRLCPGFEDMRSGIIQNMDSGPAISVHYHRPASTDLEQITDTVGSRAENFVRDQGRKAVAHLRRPSVDALSDDLESTLHQDHIVSAPHPHQIIQPMIRETIRNQPELTQDDARILLAEELELVYAGGEVHGFIRTEWIEAQKGATGQEDSHGEYPTGIRPPAAR